MAAPELSPRAVSRLHAEEKNIPSLIVQLLEVKPITKTAANSTPRYRGLISDGEHFCQAMFATSVNPLIESGQLARFSVFEITTYSVNMLAERKIVIILDASAPFPPVDHKIGEPTNVDSGGAAAPSAPTAAPSAPTAAPPAAASAPTSSGAYRGGSGGGAGGGGATRPGGMAGGMYGGGVTSGAAPMHVQRVKSLNPYSNRWHIRVRVTNKGPVKSWSNAKGEGKLFSVDLLDDAGDEIRATFFKEGVDRFYDVLLKDHVYVMGNGKLKLANKRYTSITNDYEISFDEHATVTPVEDDASIRRAQFKFVPLQRLAELEPNTMVDVLGVVKSAGDAVTIQSKKGDELHKMDLTLMDQTRYSIQITLWGELSTAHRRDELEGQVVAFKGVKLSDYGGRSLSTMGSSIFSVQPDVEDARRLRAWADSAEGAGAEPAVALTEGRGGAAGGGALGGAGGAAAGGPIADVSKRTTIAQLRDDGLGLSMQGDVVTVKGSIAMIFRNMDRPPWYPACPNMVEGSGAGAGRTRMCNKKMSEQPDNSWHCDSCNRRAEPAWRYILNAAVADHTGSANVTFFNDEAEALLHHPAADVKAVLERDAPLAAPGGEVPSFSRLLDAPKFTQKYLTLKVKMETIQDEQRLKCTVMKMRDVDFAYESTRLLDAIRAYGVL